MSEAAGLAAESAINSTAKVVASASELALSAASNSLSLGNDFWRGVDLYSIQAKRCSGNIVAESGSIIVQWLDTSESFSLLPCLDGSAKQALKNSAQSIALSLHALQTEVEEFQVSGKYGTVWVASSLTDRGTVHVSFDVVNISFQPFWSNPLWASLEFSPELEREQIIQQLQGISSSLPSRNSATVTARLPFLQGLALVCSSRLAWYARLLMTLLSDLWEVFCAATKWGGGFSCAMAITWKCLPETVQTKVNNWCKSSCCVGWIFIPLPDSSD